MMEVKEKRERYRFLDEIRGFLLLNIIGYHMIWDFNYILGFEWEWYRGTPGAIWQFLSCCGFILLSGYCWQMGKHQLRRGIEVFGAGLVITIVTIMVMPDCKVIFGVLTFLGSAMMLLIPLSKILNKIPPVLGAMVSLFLFAVFYPVNIGYLGFGTCILWELPQNWYANIFTTYLGFPESEFFSTDYFSILPWIFLYITGYFVYKIRMKKESLKWEKEGICPPFAWLGRHSLIIYLLHQPVIYGICILLFG